MRKLGIFERALLISDRHSPFNVVGVVSLEEPPLPGVLQQALEILQKRHPLLQARIVFSGRRPVFERMPETRLSLSAYDRVGDRQWEQIVEQEMAQRFDASRGPLFRVAYIYHETRAEIVITFLHPIMDAISGTNLLDELLSYSASLQAGELISPASLELAPPVETQFPPAFQGTRRIPPFLAYFFAQMGEELGYRWNTRGKRVARVQPGGKGHILSLTLPGTLLESIAQRARKEKVTLNSLLSAGMLLAVNRHLYQGVSQPMQTITFADLRPYNQPPAPKEDLASYISMLRYTVKVSGTTDLWQLACDLHGRIYPSLKQGGKFIATVMSESMMKMFTGLKSMRMCSTALNYTATVPLQTNYGNIKVSGLHAFISAMDIGPELAAQARLFNDQLWLDFMYLDSDMDTPLAEKVVAEFKEILEGAVAG